MKLMKFLHRDTIISELKALNKNAAIKELSEIISTTNPEYKLSDINSVLLEREKLGSTGIGNGIAIPHAKLGNLKEIIIAFGRSKQGIDFEAHDGKKSFLFFALLAPDNAAGQHLKVLAKLSKLLSNKHLRLKLMNAKDKNDIYLSLKQEDDK